MRPTTRRFGRATVLWNRIVDYAGIRTRILFIAILPSMLIAAAVTVSFTHQDMEAAQRALDNQAQQSALILAASSQYALISGNQASLVRVVRQNRAGTKLAYAAIYEANGPLKIQDGLAPTKLNAWPRQWNDGKSHEINGIIYRAAPIELTELPDSRNLSDLSGALPSAASVLGFAVVGISTREITAQKNWLLVSAGLVLLGALSVTTFLAWRLSNRLTRQIRDASTAVGRIAMGEFRVRLPEEACGEIGQLEHGINKMASALSEHQTRLEERIVEATAKLAAQKDEAERAIVAKSKFFAAASHDLRQPLHALVLFIGALKARIHLPDVRMLVDHIEASVDAMEMLFNSLLDISRLDAEVIEVCPAHFPAGFLLDRLKKQFTPQAEGKGLSLRVRSCACTLHSDPILLERILLNLVSNAIRYTHQGGVLVGCRRREKSLLIQVWDSGPGIPELHRDEIFQEYVQLGNPERDRSKGLGLGLASVLRLAKLLQLPLTLQSRLGKGSVFSVAVPLGSSLLAAASVPKPVQAASLDMELAVLIDDEEAILRAMEELFDTWNIDLIAARTMADALQVLDETGRTPDVVISDYRLPEDIDGIRVLEAFRARYGAGLPAIILTGDTASESIQALNQGGFTVLHKPLRPARLRSLLTHLLRQDIRV